MCNSDRPYDGDADNVTLPTRPIVHSITVYNNLVVMKYWYNTILLWHLGEFVVRGLPYGSGLGLSRCLGPGECLHSFTWVNYVIKDVGQQMGYRSLE